MTGPDLRDWAPGDEITSDRLNAVQDAARAGMIRADVSSGLESRSTPYGTQIRARRRQECWVKITSAGSGGAYGGTQQIETDAAGTWADGPLVFTSGSGRLREVNASTSVPNNAIVRAVKARFCWRFEYGAC